MPHVRARTFWRRRSHQRKFCADLFRSSNAGVAVVSWEDILDAIQDITGMTAQTVAPSPLPLWRSDHADCRRVAEYRRRARPRPDSRRGQLAPDPVDGGSVGRRRVLLADI